LKFDVRVREKNKRSFNTLTRFCYISVAIFACLRQPIPNKQTMQCGKLATRICFGVQAISKFAMGEPVEEYYGQAKILQSVMHIWKATEIA
jgi:hypothetical protein